MARRSLRDLLGRPPAPAVEDPSCDDLRAAVGPDPTPLTPQGCAECLEQGTTWVHLRLCLTCGHVGCCDTGKWRHASAHSAAEGHPVMRSFEAGEAWRWCYVHDLLG